MTSYAELLGIDMAKLEAERLYHYPGSKKTTISDHLTLAEASSEWQPIARAANLINYHVDSVRRWRNMGKVKCLKVKGRLLVYMPDVLRHAQTLK